MQENLKKNTSFQKMASAAKSLGGKKVIIFGSYAKHKAAKTSDLDVCVLVGKNKNPLEFQKEFRLKLWKIRYDWSKPLDLFVFPENIYRALISKKDPFITEVNKGLVLYG